MKKIILSLILSLIASPSFAEEVVDNSGWDAESGWAVVDNGGIVQGIIICTNSVCGEDGQWGGSMPSDTPWANMKIVRQLPAKSDGTHPGGSWGSYDESSNEFTLDRSCPTCEPFSDVYQKGTIKNGVLVQPVIIPGLDTYMLNNPELTIDEAADLLKELLAYNYSQNLEIMAKKSSATLGKKQNIVTNKKSKYRKIQLTENLKEFKKVSKTKNICKIKGNSVLIIKTGTCKIDIYKDSKKETTSVKVKK
jgi:hypothetical protein